MQQMNDVFEDLLLIQQGNNSYIHRRCNSFSKPDNQVYKTVFHSQILLETESNVHQRECQDLSNEWKILSSIKHAHIITPNNFIQNHSIETTGLKLKCCTLVLETAFGDLLTLCKSQDQMLSFNSIVRYFKQIANALSYLHSKDIAHNDVKLENILLVNRSNAKLADFGFSYKPPQDLIAKWQKRTLNCYSSPEIIRFRNQIHEGVQFDEFNSQSSDVYALTTALFLAIYKRPPILGVYPTPHDEYYQLLINDPDSFWGLEFIQKVDLQLMKEHPRMMLESLKDLLEQGLAEEDQRISMDDFLAHEFFDLAIQDS